MESRIDKNKKYISHVPGTLYPTLHLVMIQAWYKIKGYIYIFILPWTEHKEMCPRRNIIEYLNSVSWKCDFVTNQRRFTANFPTLLNRNLHPDCNNWTNIYPQCVKRNSCSLRWHLQKSSPVQIGQRKVREKAVKVKVTLKYFFPDTFQLKSKQTPTFLVTNFLLPHKGL